MQSHAGHGRMHVTAGACNATPTLAKLETYQIVELKQCFAQLVLRQVAWRTHASARCSGKGCPDTCACTRGVHAAHTTT